MRKYIIKYMRKKKSNKALSKLRKQIQMEREDQKIYDKKMHDYISQILETNSELLKVITREELCKKLIDENAKLKKELHDQKIKNDIWRDDSFPAGTLILDGKTTALYVLQLQNV